MFLAWKSSAYDLNDRKWRVQKSVALRGKSDYQSQLYVNFVWG